jgi:RNA processing factor Prp31
VENLRKSASSARNFFHSFSRNLVLNERSEINKLLFEIRNSIDDTINEIRQTESFLKNIRQRLFPEIEKELADL